MRKNDFGWERPVWHESTSWWIVYITATVAIDWFSGAGQKHRRTTSLHAKSHKHYSKHSIFLNVCFVSGGCKNIMYSWKRRESANLKRNFAEGLPCRVRWVGAVQGPTTCKNWHLGRPSCYWQHMILTSLLWLWVLRKASKKNQTLNATMLCGLLLQDCWCEWEGTHTLMI